MGISGEGVFQAEGTARAETLRQECAASMLKQSGRGREGQG